MHAAAAESSAARKLRPAWLSRGSYPCRVPRGGLSHEVWKRAYISARFGHHVPTGNGPPLHAPAE